VLSLLGLVWQDRDTRLDSANQPGQSGLATATLTTQPCHHIGIRTCWSCLLGNKEKVGGGKSLGSCEASGGELEEEAGVGKEHTQAGRFGSVWEQPATA